ncbi:hypothetical protein [Fictibacillus enclensis]|uniref:hypothetical protein n=1 Tax=Fictibacillus enclensis TaxID=1017270 RepID=UPI0024C04C2E|nr:hypothetical protein [Fictibacillus enclensis]WHY74504.1 hypothetical protein QNH15_11580 [Fictibacillus enclensis]
MEKKEFLGEWLFFLRGCIAAYFVVIIYQLVGVLLSPYRRQSLDNFKAGLSAMEIPSIITFGSFIFYQVV